MNHTGLLVPMVAGLFSGVGAVDVFTGAGVVAGIAAMVALVAAYPRTRRAGHGRFEAIVAGVCFGWAVCDIVALIGVAIALRPLGLPTVALVCDLVAACAAMAAEELVSSSRKAPRRVDWRSHV